jgi:hypothetical protein
MNMPVKNSFEYAKMEVPNNYKNRKERRKDIEEEVNTTQRKKRMGIGNFWENSRQPDRSFQRGRGPGLLVKQCFDSIIICKVLNY